MNWVDFKIEEKFVRVKLVIALVVLMKVDQRGEALGPELTPEMILVRLV